MTVTLLSPTLGPAPSGAAPTARPTSLDGAVLGLINNGKTHGREILHRVAENLADRHAIADIILVTKPTASHPPSTEQLEQLAGATAIIAAIGD